MHTHETNDARENMCVSRSLRKHSRSMVNPKSTIRRILENIFKKFSLRIQPTQTLTTADEAKRERMVEIILDKIDRAKSSLHLL